MSPQQQKSTKLQEQIDRVKAYKKHVKQLVREHLPYFRFLFKDVQNEDETNAEASTSSCMPAEGEEMQEDAALPSAIFDDDDRVSENRLKAARGYNASTAYCSKQFEYLLFCETVYASLHRATRNKLLTFLRREVVIGRTLRRSGVLYINDKTRANVEASANTSTNSSAQYD
ncbi:hypothetical protein [Parasitella parasitica]|uniref:Uncharacterized protein n=1 Tax=Parasitella parasitica TaxID=35722 RepID=A0A0B7NQU6_9FUNG|nr:hypothetical protein [Parasitella parasitica]